MNDLVSIVMPIIIWKPVHIQMTTHCLDNIRMFTQNFEFIILVSGNIHSHDKQTLRQRMRRQDRIIFFNKKNISQPASLNLGISKARGKYICLMQNDVYVHQDWLRASLAAFKLAEEANRFGLIGSFWSRPESYTKHKKFINNYKGQFNIADTSFPFICMNGTLATKETYEKIGPFDERLPFFYWDRDYVVRLSALGFSCGYCTLSYITHLESFTRNYVDDFPDNLECFYGQENQNKEGEYFTEKHGFHP